jgi:hypothetical protein
MLHHVRYLHVSIVRFVLDMSLKPFARGWGMVWGVFQDYHHSNGFSGTPLSTLSLVGGVYFFVNYLFFFPSQPLMHILQCMNGSSYFFGGIGDRL